tara:strand:+ start:1684 stop:2442 length:759 start_codon:yes stop_codon:yes gene_type:complete
MPNMFTDNPIAGKQFRSAWKDPKSIVALIPSSPIKNELDIQLKYLESLKEPKEDVIKTEKPSIDSKLSEYETIINLYSNIFKNNNNYPDILVEQKYLELQNDREFQKWLQNYIETQVSEILIKLNINFANNSNVFVTEENAKSNIITYQENVIQTLSEWVSYIDSQIEEQTSIQKNLETILATQQRKGIFSLSDISYLEKWKNGMDFVFWVLVVLFIIIIIINYSQELFNMYKNIQNITINKIENLKNKNIM